jgi:hypothetical protein
MSYRVVGAISNGGPKYFPVERLKFRFNSVAGNGVNDQGSSPNAGNLGVNTNPFLFSIPIRILSITHLIACRLLTGIL